MPKREIGVYSVRFFSRANRLMGTLASLGLAERTANRKYAPGAGLHVLAAMSLRGSRLLSSAWPHLEWLRATEPGLTVALGVRWRTQVAYLFYAQPGEELQAAIASRGLYAVEKSSIGMALLAQHSAAEVRELYRSEPLGEGRAVKISSLLQDLTTTRKLGYACFGGETVAVTVGQPPVAALALAGKLARHDLARLVGNLREAAKRIESTLDNRT